MQVYCERCFILFALQEEKIFWRGKMWHRRCLAAVLKSEKKKNILIKDSDLYPYKISGLYNAWKYKPREN